MTEGYNRNIILIYLDAPSRVGFLPMDEALYLLLPFFAGLLLGFPGTGSLLGILGFIVIRQCKAMLGGRILIHGLYRYFPGVHKRMKIKIVSSKRRYIG